jgi:hypothetical protein
LKRESGRKLDKQLKGVTSMVEKQTRNLPEDIEATRRDVEATRRDLGTQLAVVEARTRRAGSADVGTNVDKVKPPKFYGLTSWGVFHCQFEAAANHNDWTPKEKTAHLLSVLPGKAAVILHSVPAKASYEDIVGVLQNRFGDHQLAAAYRSQLKVRVQMRDEREQEFAAAVEQLAHRALVGLPVGFIQTDTAHAFINEVPDREVKQHLLIGGDRALNEALNQALTLEEAKAAAGPLPRLREVIRAPSGTTPSPPQRRRDERPVCWQCGTAGHLRRDCRHDQSSGNE